MLGSAWKRWRGPGRGSGIGTSTGGLAPGSVGLDTAALPAKNQGSGGGASSSISSSSVAAVEVRPMLLLPLPAPPTRTEMYWSAIHGSTVA